MMKKILYDSDKKEQVTGSSHGIAAAAAADDDDWKLQVSLNSHKFW